MKRQRSLQPHPRSSAADADHSLAVRGTDLQKAMEHVAAIAGDNPVHAFETAMHAVTSQLAQGAASGGAPAYAPGPMHGPGRAGLLHRRAGSSMDCFADVAIARMESGWALNATDLLGISANPGEMGEWYVLTPGEQGGRRAFRIDANAAGLRLHPAPPAARSTPFNAHLLSLDNVRVADDDAWDLGPAQAPAKPSCAWCPSIAPWPPRSAADWDAPPAAFCRRRRFRPRHAAPFPRRGRRGRASS